MRWIIVVMLIIPFVGFAQTDSTEIKLQQYKDLHDKGLINEKEYEDLKRGALKIPAPQVKRDTVNLPNLLRTYKAQLISGSLELVSGAGLLGAGLYFKDKEGYYNSRGDYIGYTKQARISFICGAIFTGIGIYSIAKGSKNKNKYLELKSAPSGVSFNLTF